MMQASEQQSINLIEIPSQNNFCGYYALARRIINDKNFAVILDQFNQFYQTNWYFDELVEVVDKMHPEQAEIMLGLVIQHLYPLSSVEGTGLSEDELELICERFGYEPVIFVEDDEDYVNSVQTTLGEPTTTHKILISFDPPISETTIGHYRLIEPNDEIFARDMSLRHPNYQGIYTINNQGGEKFIDNIKASVADIKPKWANELKSQQIQNDKRLAWGLAIEDVRAINLRFFKNQTLVRDVERTQIIELQRKEIEYYNSLLTK